MKYLVLIGFLVLAGCAITCDETSCKGTFSFPIPKSLVPTPEPTPVPTPVPVAVVNRVTLEK